MGLLTDSDLAIVSLDKKIHLYYQDGSEIHEATSNDGYSWKVSSGFVANGLAKYHSPITAFPVTHDGVEGGSSTIHVLYTNADSKLHEVIYTDGAWKKRTLESALTNAPTNTSSLASGTCHDAAPGAHQWLFLESLNEKGQPQLSEFRSGEQSDFDWVPRKDMDLDRGSALPGASYAVNLNDTYTHLYFQAHDGNVYESQGTYEEWSLQISTALAAVSSPVADKPYVYFLGGGAPGHVQQYFDGEITPVVSVLPGSKLGAVKYGEKILLFHIPLYHAANVYTHVYDGKSWSAGVKVL